MSLTEFFHSIDAPIPSPGVTNAEITKAETRLGGRFPEALRAWFREADGFTGEAEVCFWRFMSLQRLHTISEIFPAATEISVSRDRHAVRRAVGSHYVVVCDALFYLPFYAVNICPDSSHYSEVICAAEESATDADFVASSFESFSELLFQNPNDAVLIAKA